MTSEGERRGRQASSAGRARLGWAYVGLACVGAAWMTWRLRNLGMPIDLAVYRQAGSHVLRDADIYVRQSGNPFIEAFGRGYVLRNSFSYPPFAALVFTPLAALSTAWVTVAWLAASLIALLAIVRISFQRLLDHVRRPGLCLGLLAIVFLFTSPVTDALFFGQIDLFIVLLLLVDCTRSTKHRGIATGLATAIKLTPGLFIVFFLLTRQWKAAVRAIGTFAVATSLAWVVLPDASWRYWTQPDSVLRRIGGIAFFANQSITGALLRLSVADWVTSVCIAIVTVLGLAAARGQHNRGANLAAASSVGLVTLLVSPVSWIHHAVWIVPALGVVVWDGTEVRRDAIAGSFTVVFLLRLPLFGSILLQHGGPTVLGDLLENAYVVAYLGLLLVLRRLVVSTTPDPDPIRPHAK